MRWSRRLSAEHDGLATIEYVIGAAVILGTLVIGVSAWNNGLVTRLQALVTQLQTVRGRAGSATFASRRIVSDIA